MRKESDESNKSSNNLFGFFKKNDVLDMNNNHLEQTEGMISSIPNLNHKIPNFDTDDSFNHWENQKTQFRIEKNLNNKDFFKDPYSLNDETTNYNSNNNNHSYVDDFMSISDC